MAGAGKRLQQLLQAKPYLITLGLAGILVIVSGLAAIGIGLGKVNEPQLEIIEASMAPAVPLKILIDIGGAVEKPGIYEFSSEARVNDALVAAGGLSGEADRDWVSQNLNLAGKLTDGVKIYIPFQDETDTNKDSPSLRKGESLNLNTASLAELDTLWGIGPATGQKIIDSRPYAKIEELLEKKIVKSNVYEAIKDKITVL